MALRVRQPAATPARTLRYGPHREQVADLWLPAGPGPHPTVVSVHGGYFQAAHGRDLHDPMAHRLVGAGIAVLNVEYRRANAGGSFHETTQDVLAAVDLLGSVPDVRLRRGVAAVGHSAGGYLALWAAAHPDVELVVALAAASDLPDCVRGGYDGGGVAHWMGRPPTLTPTATSARTCGAGCRPQPRPGSSTAPPTRWCRSPRASGTRGPHDRPGTRRTWCCWTVRGTSR